MRFKNRRILVTGGAGFIGSNLVSALLNEGAEVVVLDDLSTGEVTNLPQSKSLEFIKGSVTDEDIVSRCMGKVEIVVHLAARNIMQSLEDPIDDFKVNIGGTLNLLLLAKRKGISKFIYASSCSVYGNSRYLPISEDEPCRTLSPYSVSKLAGENYCMTFYELYDMPVTVLRYSNVYGPKQSPTNPYCGVIGKFIHRIIMGEPPLIHGDGEQTRDFTYVGDAVEATLLAILSPKSIGEVFNIGTGIETRVIDIVQILAELLHKPLSPQYIEKRDIDNVRRRVLNIEKIRMKLKWSPNVTLKEGLSKTIEWYKSAK